MNHRNVAAVPVQISVRKSRQQGAALIEFAFVLLPLLLLTVGTLLYGLVFVTQQAFAFAAQRGADAIVQVDPDSFRSADGKIRLAETDRDQATITGYCTAGFKLAKKRVKHVLPSVALFQHSVSVQAEISGRRGCTVTVTGGGILPEIPLIPMPHEIAGVGFVPAP